MIITSLHRAPVNTVNTDGCQMGVIWVSDGYQMGVTLDNGLKSGSWEGPGLGLVGVRWGYASEPHLTPT